MSYREKGEDVRRGRANAVDLSIRQKNVTRMSVTQPSHAFGHVHVAYRFFG